MYRSASLWPFNVQPHLSYILYINTHRHVEKLLCKQRHFTPGRNSHLLSRLCLDLMMQGYIYICHGNLTFFPLAIKWFVTPSSLPLWNNNTLKDSMSFNFHVFRSSLAQVWGNVCRLAENSVEPVKLNQTKHNNSHTTGPFLQMAAPYWVQTADGASRLEWMNFNNWLVNWGCEFTGVALQLSRKMFEKEMTQIFAGITLNSWLPSWIYVHCDKSPCHRTISLCCDMMCTLSEIFKLSTESFIRLDNAPFPNRYL